MTKRIETEGLHHAPFTLGRRQFLAATACVLAAPLEAFARDAAPALSESTRTALAQSKYVYVSPIKTDGEESRCHGEVWYGWFEGSVFMSCAPDSWKARAIAKGLGRARVWVGDYGRWKKVLGENPDFLNGPRFEAAAGVSEDTDQVARLLAELARKYPKEFPGWKDRMETGHRDGSRLLLRYTPVSA